MRKRHTECACYNRRRRGLTLVELLVVITILTMVTAATIPLMAPATGQRKVRESARLIATLLAQAQARALSTGRPVGVWIERLSSAANDARANQSIDLFLCQVPPPYTGLATGATCTVDAGGVVNMQQIPKGWVHAGDRIRFNYRGPLYRIAGVGPNQGAQSAWPDGSLTGENMATGPAIPPPAQGVPYQIYRQPVKTADEPVTLPAGAMIDLAFSGVGNGIDFSVPIPQLNARNPTSLATGVADRPVCIMFGPSGNLDSVYFGFRPSNSSQSIYEPAKPIAAVYLLVGQTPNDTAASRLNIVNSENVWVAVNPQSGLVTTSELAVSGDDNFTIDWRRDPDVVAAFIGAARAFARSAQNMGGR